MFQVLRVEGQNDGRAEPLLVPCERFEAFVHRHKSLATEGTVRIRRVCRTLGVPVEFAR